MKMKKFVLLISLTLFLTGCMSTYPLGMSEEQWKSITPEERKALLLKQQQYEEEQRLVRMKAQAKERELQLKRDIEEKKRLQKLYNNPRDGNVVMINILGGNYQYGKTTKRVLEDTYQIARGEIKQITLHLEDPKKHYHSTEKVYLHYAQNGNGIYLYLDHPNRNSSNRIALLRNGQWSCGSQYTKNLYTRYEKLHNMQMFVKQSGGHCGRNSDRHVYKKYY